MSGHSKWHNIRLRKGKMDAERGAKFTKLAREIIVAAKTGGGNPEANLRLRLAIQKARENSMPQDKIKNAIQRGTGEVEGAVYEEIFYEGYGPGGVAIMIECATDNRNRTVADIRSILSKNGGHLGESGSVGWMFNAPQGLVVVSRGATDEDALIDAALEAGADDVRATDEAFEVYTDSGSLGRVVDALEQGGIKPQSSEIARVPNNTVRVDGKDAQQVLRLMDLLDEHDDVQRVFANFDIPDEVLETAAR
ncbi:MAG: YebC/PmpR family DNA-binding transcriptional regulator [Chthonomonadales bacterium]|nr:YebC/PmpR family DNA-binding transcriptional regulator [Chthonomonadales bacterium]